MKKQSISFKLFIITSLFLFMLISISLLVQSLFFGRFYFKEKTTRLISHVEGFKSDYINNINTSEELFDSVYKFEDTNNAQIAFLNRNGVVKFTRNSLSTKQNSNSSEVISLAIKNWVASQENYFDVLINKKTISFNFKNPILNTNNLVVVSPVVSKGSVQDIIFVISTLQPVDEATSIMRKYYIYIYIAALAVIAILSLIYSKMISNPLIKLNKEASKMSNLDFSVKCEINSKDEIGNLASTLNFLSRKLNSTLTELKDANEKLKEDIEKERRIERLRKEFIAGVSHELKTPISLIEGYTEGLKDGIVDDEDKDYYFNVIIDESEKMGKLVNDMLDLSQLESGTFKLNISKFNLYDFIHSIYKKYLNNIQNKKLLLKYNIIDKSLLVKGDIFRMEGVISNLLNNAIRHTSIDGYITIKVEDDKLGVKISIENEGDKIPEDELSLIWEKFYRIDKSRNKKLGGTGLGLAIVKNILNLHNSKYGVENTNNGVNFYFTLLKESKN